MYEGFYGFRERPFTLLPDPDFLFLDEKHRTALEMLEAAVSDRSGFCVISGEIGAGKTTLVRELLNRLDETVCVGLVSNTHPSFGGLLQWIMAAYGLSCEDSDGPDLHKRFIEFVIQQFTQKKHTLLIIDEAQNLSVEALEELRALADVNTERDLILQVILVGQQQLRDALAQPELEQFSQGVTLNYHLQALDQDETSLYIQHRVSHAGGQTGLFSVDACQAVYRLSGGIPRVINRLCDLSLVYGCTAQSEIITAELVNMVGEDQRMGTLLDIQQIDPEVTPPEQTEQSTNIPAQKKGESETSSAAPIASGVPARIIDGLQSETEAGKLSSDTIVGSISPVLMPELDTTFIRKEGSTEKPAPSELHQLVVKDEQKKRARGERGALWLLLGVVVMAGGTGWLMRDFQSAEPVALSGDSEEHVTSPTREDDRQLSVAVDADLEKPDAGKDAEAELISAQKAAKAEAEQRAASQELERKARLEREKIAAEKAAAAKKAKAEAAAKAEALAKVEATAAQQRAAELSRQAEETARLKKESDRMEREQRAAERRLAKQRAARKELERKAQRERKKMAAAREAAKKLAEERSRASTVSSKKAVQKPVPRKPVPRGRAPVEFVEAAVPSYDEDDGDAIVLDAKAGFVSEGAKGVVASPVQPVAESTEGEVEFAANPCNGPTARFLSTCR